MTFSFGKRSLDNLATCHEDLHAIAKEAILDSQIDFGISEGHRSVERQKELYDKQLSKIDGINKKGKHNYNPSLAFDVYAYVKDNRKLAYDEKHLCTIAGTVIGAANKLFRNGSISHIIRWGGNWDMDGQIVYDQSFQDLPHFELKKP